MEITAIHVLKQTVIISLSLILVSVCLPGNTTEASPKIVDFYPQCDYEVVDTVNAKQRIDNELQALSPIQYKNAFNKIVDKLKRAAQVANAEQIVLLNKTSTKSFNQHFMVFSAELVNTCKKDPSFERKLANLDSNGKTQIALTNTVLEIENKIVFNLPMVEKRLEPELRTTQIDLSGAYGVKLGDSLQSVMDVLGTPTVEISVSDNLSMLMYGRRHMFEFVNGNLHAIVSNNPHFSSDLNNLLEFDDRFDDLNWQVKDIDDQHSYSKNKQLSAQQINDLSAESIVIKRDANSLLIQTEKNDGYGSKPASYTVKSFLLHESPYHTNDKIKAQSSKPILSFLSEQLENEDPSFTIEDIPFSATMKAWVGPAKRLYVYGQHVAIEVIGNRITTIHLLENLFAEDSPFYTQETWFIGPYKQGMSADSATIEAGQEALYFNEELEITRENLTYRLYFYEQKREVRLYGGEINFF